MKDLLIFIAIVLFGLIPFGYAVVWTLYRKTIVFTAALLVFLSSMFCSIVAFAVSEFGFNSLYWAIPLCLVFLLSTNFFIKRLIQKPLKVLSKTMEEVATGNLKLTIDERTLKPAHEIGTIARSFEKLIGSLQKISHFADEIAKNNFEIQYNLLSENDQIGNSLLNMSKSLIKAQEIEAIRKIKEEQENWTNQGIAKFSDILRSNSDNINVLSQHFVSELVNYLNIVQGGIFVLNEENPEDIYFNLQAAVAYNRQKLFEKQFRIGESLVGRCAYEKLPIYMTEVPENYVQITSGLGEANPRCIVLIPAVMEEKVYAVIELVSFQEFQPYQLEFISKIGSNLASTISMVKIHEQTSKLLLESQLQKDELSAQEEELRQNMEELVATQEEMKRKEFELNQLNEKLQAKLQQLEFQSM